MRAIFTVREAAQYLQISTKTLYRILHDGDIAYVKVRSSIRITAEALEAYISQGGRPHEH